MSDSNLQTSRRTLPGELGLWIFILSDLMLFGLYFVLFAWDLRADPTAFYQSQENLDRTLGLINTLLLLSGSWAVFMGTRVEADLRRCANYLLVAAITGGLFLLLKSVEYSHLFTAGASLTDSRFFTWYFFLTAYHAIHVVAGMVLLINVALRQRRQESLDERLVEAAGCYWHLVDLLWIGIFSIAYLL